MRPLYAFLIRLHPASFRERFADEMLWIFDEAANSWGSVSLFRDATISLARQWLVRAEAWKWLVAGIAAFLPLLIAFGSFLPWHRAMHP